MTADEYPQQLITKYRVSTGTGSPAETAGNEIYPIIQKWAGNQLREVRYSGSTAKGTSIKGTTDVDLFVSLKSDTSNTLKEIFDSLHSTMKNSARVVKDVDSRFTKSEKKELRKLAGLAYERELAKALEALEESFRQWKKKKISAFELSECIHKFHNGSARNLWNLYETGHAETSARHAITEGIILKTEVCPGILEKLQNNLNF